ncbi:MAG: type II toxin-antitoxin system VapC family toxin [Thermodesulfobacteriota bacterium]
MRYLVDTCIWIKLLRRDRAAGRNFVQALWNDDEILVSGVVYFELIRGFRRTQDRSGEVFILSLWERLTYVEMSRPVWDRAADLWAESVRRNMRREDADTVMAALASVLDAVVVTDNVRHFESFPVRVVNWAASE